VQNAVAPDSKPQITMMRAIQSRAPTLSKMRLLGTSNKKYPQKKAPAAKTIRGGIEPQLLVRGKRRETDVDAIQVAEKYVRMASGSRRQ
jgi:hypothetical protein